MSEFKSWMDRCVGSWTSFRRYYFGEHMNPGDFTTLFDIESTGDLEYRISWTGQTEGVMDLTLDGNLLSRSRSYFNANDDTTAQEMTRIDDDTVVFHTAYGGKAFREEIRFINDDIRLRQTIGFNEADGKFALCGQYFEVRKLE